MAFLDIRCSFAESRIIFCEIKPEITREEGGDDRVFGARIAAVPKIPADGFAAPSRGAEHGAWNGERHFRGLARPIIERITSQLGRRDDALCTTVADRPRGFFLPTEWQLAAAVRASRGVISFRERVEHKASASIRRRADWRSSNFANALDAVEQFRVFGARLSPWTAVSF